MYQVVMVARGGWGMYGHDELERETLEDTLDAIYAYFLERPEYYASFRCRQNKNCYMAMLDYENNLRIAEGESDVLGLVRWRKGRNQGEMVGVRLVAGLKWPNKIIFADRKGAVPKHGDVWIASVRDTRPDDRAKGALIATRVDKPWKKS